ncbi:MAG: VacJ family lipoprotein [Steroidobacteraceae bacterium]
MRTAFAGLAAALLLTGCAALPPGERDPRDRFERMNRSVYRFNDALDRGIAKPVATAYVKVTPQPIRTGVSNFFANLTYPATMANDLLQGKLRHFARDTTRFVVNTTLGIGGLFDPATRMKLAAHKEDFGQTLGRWGVPAGPYLVLPILGSSTVRDSFGDLADEFVDAKNYIKDQRVRYGLWALDMVDRRAGLLSAGNVLEKSYDPYVFIRNAYLERRAYLIRDGVTTGDEVEIIDTGDDSAGE